MTHTQEWWTSLGVEGRQKIVLSLQEIRALGLIAGPSMVETVGVKFQPLLDCLNQENALITQWFKPLQRDARKRILNAFHDVRFLGERSSTWKTFWVTLEPLLERLDNDHHEIVRVQGY